MPPNPLILKEPAMGFEPNPRPADYESVGPHITPCHVLRKYMFLKEINNALTHRLSSGIMHCADLLLTQKEPRPADNKLSK
jgi:hypothetical protein